MEKQSSQQSSGGNKGQKEEEKKEDEKQPGQLKTCQEVKVQHILCEQHSQALEAYNSIFEIHGKNPSGSEFGKVAQAQSECSSAKRGGDLGWFGRGQMVGEFQDVAFSTPEGEMSQLFQTEHGYHFLLVEGRRN